MVSRPSAYTSSHSREKTASRSGARRAAAAQSGLSLAASSAMDSQRSVAEEVSDGLHRCVGIVLGVRERDEHGFELRRGDVDPSLEQIPEERRVPLRVGCTRIVVVAHRPVEEREHRADPLHGSERRESILAPPRATRKPVITSSNTNNAPDASQSSRSTRRNPGTGGTTPMFPATGSTTMHARPSPYCATAPAAASTSLYGATIVWAVTDCGTPSDVGMPSVATPEPASASRASTWP